ncbi:MAG: hypothetical protein HY372_01515, partial [Candidatus Andersenbacteria bacterium]|nr:hypothetical protein [Candidatus Andersenbacteria bacterium]
MSAGWGNGAVVLLTAAAVAATVMWLPLGSEFEPLLFDVDLGARETLWLVSGETARRVLAVPGQTITGVALSSLQEKVGGGMEILILVDGKVVRRSSRFWQSWRGDSARLTFPVQSFVLPAGTAVELEVRRTAGDPLPLQVTRDSGALTVSLVHPVPLEAGARRGVMAGLAVMLAAYVLGALKRWQWAAAAAAVAVVSPLVLAGFLRPAGVLGVSDWDYYFTVHTRYRDSLLKYHTFPFWNAYTCGGTAGLADPEFPVISPLYPLELLFGVSGGLRLAVVVSVAVGGLGMLTLARRLNLSPTAGLLAALIVSFSSTTLLKLTEGHIDMLAAMWMPWIFWSWHHAYTREQHRTQSTNSRQSTEHRAQSSNEW